MKDPLTGRKMKNPLTGKKVARDVAEYVLQLRAVRRNAKAAARSGNPAKRQPALKVLADVGPVIGVAYQQDAARRRRQEQMKAARKAGLR